MRLNFAVLLILIGSCAADFFVGASRLYSQEVSQGKLIALPKIAELDNLSLNQCLLGRKSIRSFSKESLSLVEIAHLLWAAQGVTTGRHRTVPSAGGLYPVEIYLVVAKGGEELERGLYQYGASQHVLRQISAKHLAPKVAKVSAEQGWIAQAPALIVFAAQPDRTIKKYKERGERFVLIEIGNATQNVHLQAVALKLGTTVVGAFDDEQIKDLLELPEDQHVYALMPVGKVN
jgi:SagB-type dehydrogenase family enzyme